MTWFSTFIADEGSAVITSWPSYSLSLCFVHARRMQDALPKLLSKQAHYVSCNKFVLYVSVLFVNFTDAEYDFLFFPFEVQISLSANVVVVGKVVLINTSVLLFSQWELAHIIFIFRPAWKFELGGGSDNSLTVNTSLFRRTKPIVSLKGETCSCDVLQVSSFYRGLRNISGDARDFKNMDLLAVIKFVFPVGQGAEGDLRHSDWKMRRTCTILSGRPSLNLAIFPPVLRLVLDDTQ